MNSQNEHQDIRNVWIHHGWVWKTQLSSDPIERQKQLEEDDQTAEDEWKWFYHDSDFYAIEDNPFLPNSTEHAYNLWEMYLSRYEYELDKIKRYRIAWLAVFNYILATNDTESMQFPAQDDFNWFDIDTSWSWLADLFLKYTMQDATILSWSFWIYNCMHVRIKTSTAAL